MIKEVFLNQKKILSVIILSLNRLRLTLRCLESLYKGSVLDIEVILLDQGSPPHETSQLRNLTYPNLKYYECKNKFCLGGRNYAAKFATGKYLLFCDDDMILPDKWDIKLLGKLYDLKADGISPTVLEKSGGEYKVKFHAVKIHNNDFLDIGKGHISKNQLHAIRTHILPGGSLCVRKNIFDQIPFDETFVFGCGDFDWSMKARTKRYKFYSCPEVQFIHDRDGFQRVLNAQYNKPEIKVNAKDIVIRAIQLFMWRYRKELSGLFDRKDWTNPALGKFKNTITNKNNIKKYIKEQVNVNFPKEPI